jgi:NHLM bacteriocin system ABC transporter ATP-binding protein
VVVANAVKPSANKTKSMELLLLDLRYRMGQLISVEGNQPLLLNDREMAWVVYSGMIDVFSVPVQGNEVVGTRTHLFRGGAGQLLLGLNENTAEQGITLLVSGTPGTRVLRLRRSQFMELADEPEYESIIISMMNDWVTALSIGTFHKILPKEYTLLEPDHGAIVEVNEQTTITPKKGVVWLSVRSGQVQMAGEEKLLIGGANELIPLAQFAWLRPAGQVKVSVLDTQTVVAQKTAWNALENYHRLVVDAIVLKQSRETTEELERLRKSAESERQLMENALLRLGSTLSDEISFIKSLKTGLDAFSAAATLVAEAQAIELLLPPAAVLQGLAGFELVEKMAQASRMRIREVALRGNWWQRDNGPLLGFTQDNQPVALIPQSANHYQMVDPMGKARRPVNQETAGQLSSLAYSFYRPFPSEVVTAWNVLKFGLQQTGPDLRRLALVGLGLGLLRLLPPIATGYIFNTYIPQANVAGLVQMGLALLLVAVVASLFQIVQGTAMLRVQSRIDTSVQAALWDRLLNLPLPFYRQFTAGDLGTRVMGAAAIRRLLSGYVLNTILTFVFTLFNLGLLFFYSAMLALLAVGLVLVASVVILVGTVYDVHRQRELGEARGKLSGLVLQLLTGIVKLRITASEHQAFALWTESFVNQNKIYYRARQATNNLITFNGVYPLFCSLAIFTVVGYSSTQAGLTTGDFLAFNLAFVQFLGAWVAVSNSLAAVAVAVPIYERLRPILDAKPEADRIKVTAHALTGRIEVSHISYRYSEKTPMVLKDISLRIEPGEFVAFVGPSGSGKSTLMRLLLGFDRPEAGGIYYDGQNLADLDIREVRRQLGVVLQNSALMSGTVYENIVGATNLSVEDAWEAARMVGLAEDIEEMPMKMNTVISGYGGTLSGGQRQRVMIARAVVNRPRILFFDEATSALDNRTQEIVSQSLQALQATRMVIAHRLSTIIKADRIYVFAKGEIVQVGNYEALMQQSGPFAELAKRQMV